MSIDRHFIIGTAGHVDHGKTALIRALTGEETDRLKEEQERGISIDLGFAPFRLPGGETAGVVDVPGHERFIHNMLAGIGGIDLVLLVVDVMEGVMPQTREHLQILQLLEIPRGIVVLTKCDLADEEWIDLVEEEIREEVAETFLKEAPFCRVSALSGTGLPALAQMIHAQLKASIAKDCDGPLRLPVDRHFTVPGFGTVVTGTLLSGKVRVGDQVEVLPPGERVRVREVQVHGHKVDEAHAGQRAALNLAGLDRERLKRGSVVGTPGIFEQTARLDARLSLLPSAPRPLKVRDPIHFYLGTARVVGVVVPLDRDVMEPGESALVQIHLDRPLVAHRQDRFIVRSYSPMTTIGGGSVIDPNPAKHRRFRAEVMQALAELESGEKSFLLQKLVEQGSAQLKELELLSGMGQERIAGHLEKLADEGKVIRIADQWATTETVRAWRLKMTAETDRFHVANPLLPGIPHATLKSALPSGLLAKTFEKLLSVAVAEQELVQRGEHIARPGFAPTLSATEQQQVEMLEAAYLEEGAQAKNKQEMCDRLRLDPVLIEPLFGYLVNAGRLVRLSDESYFHASVYQRAMQLLRQHFTSHETLTLAEFRDQLGSARKQVQAFLEHCDALKYTLRKGDARVAWKLPGETPSGTP
jgi:selenocysteine-specific elongation factor